MTIDLRDHLDAFEAVARRLLETPRAPRLTLVHANPARCHPSRPHAARGLCRSCYQLAWRNGTVEQHTAARTRRAQPDFIADYRLLRSEGYTRGQIAERLGMRYAAVTAAYLRAVRAGALAPDRRTA